MIVEEMIFQNEMDIIESNQIKVQDKSDKFENLNLGLSHKSVILGVLLSYLMLLVFIIILNFNISSN